jgi:hypothetical protein
MNAACEIRSVFARLVSEPPLDRHSAASGGRLYRPLVVGPALLRRPGRGGRWWVRVSTDGRLLPGGSSEPGRLRRRMRRLQSTGVIQRIAAALVTPQDLTGPLPRLVPGQQRPKTEFYGWSLMYQLPGMRRVAAIDPHDRFTGLPAFFESPAELLDRSEFLMARGIPSRPLALITQPADFDEGDDGRRCNRFYPGQRFRRPAELEWFA